MNASNFAFSLASGIYEEKTRQTLYFIGTSLCSKPKKYGYRSGTSEEAKKLKLTLHPAPSVTPSVSPAHGKLVQSVFERHQAFESKQQFHSLLLQRETERSHKLERNMLEMMKRQSEMELMRQDLQAQMKLLIAQAQNANVASSSGASTKEKVAPKI